MLWNSWCLFVWPPSRSNSPPPSSSSLELVDLNTRLIPFLLWCLVVVHSIQPTLEERKENNVDTHVLAASNSMHHWPRSHNRGRVTISSALEACRSHTINKYMVNRLVYNGKLEKQHIERYQKGSIISIRWYRPFVLSHKKQPNTNPNSGNLHMSSIHL